MDQQNNLLNEPLYEEDNISEHSDSHQGGIKFTLSYLSSLIPKGFNGDRKKLNKFLVSCNLAFSLAAPEQETPLLYTVITKLEDPALTQLMHAELDNWKDLKEKLITLYREKKQYTQLFEELNNLKQIYKEPIVKFFARIEFAVAETVNEIKQIEKNKTLLPGAINNIEMIALSRFLYHSHPDISRILRITKPKTLQEAYAIAIEEEKSLSYLANQNYANKFDNAHFRGGNFQQNQNKNFNRNYENQNKNFQNNRMNEPQNNSRASDNKNCLRCGKYGHFAKECYKNRAQTFLIQNCNYCKKDGHLIDECQIRERNNKMTENPPIRRNLFPENKTEPKICRYCKKTGHLIEECFKLKNAQNRNKPPETPINYRNQNYENEEPIPSTSEATFNLNYHQPPTSDCQLWGSEIENLQASNQ